MSSRWKRLALATPWALRVAMLAMCCGLLIQATPAHAEQEGVYLIGCTTIYTPDCGPGQNLVGTDREAMCQHPAFNGWTAVLTIS